MSAPRAKKKPPLTPSATPRLSDVRGIAALAAQGTLAISGVVEDAHQSVRGTLGLRAGRTAASTAGLTGLIYQSINGITRVLARHLDKALLALQPQLETIASEPPDSPRRELFLAVLNGVMGDRLAATGNPLATTMSLRHDGHALALDAPLDLPAASAKALLLVHGLCMSDCHWNHLPPGAAAQSGASVNHGIRVAQALGYTPLFLRYNTGLPVGVNGEALAAQIECLMARWPQAPATLSLVGYSMGGLLVRSACAAARKAGMRWPQQLRHLVFLATPHHGAPLERAGNWADALLGSTPWSAPYARLLQLRSAGITDLRYGNTTHDSAGAPARFRRTADTRLPAPLPAEVNCFALAATRAARRAPLHERLIGDGLVPLDSALGRHRQAQHTLNFPATRQAIVYRASHLDVLGHPQVTQQLLDWLA